MRLIDTDKIHRSRAKITEGSKSFYKEWFSASAIDNAPTVEAIPIEWLKKKCNEADNIGMGIDDWSVKDCYELVLEDWEKENGVK